MRTNEFCGLARAALISVGALYGCGAPVEGEDVDLGTPAEQTEEAALGTAEQPMTGGTLTNAYDSVSKIIQGSQTCTATRLNGTQKFLTAAHCITNRNATTITLIPHENGTSDQVSLSIPTGGIQVHPSYLMRGADGVDLVVYDVAVITTTTNLSGVPGLGGGLHLPSSAPPGGDFTGTAIGYGCDNNDSSHNGKRQRGFFHFSNEAHDHCLLATLDDELCFGDSGGPLISNTDATILGVADAFGLGFSIWSRTGNIRQWILDPKPANDPSLLTSSKDVFFMHNKKAGANPRGLCMAANSNVNNPPTNPSVLLHFCADPLGNLTGKGPGWTTLFLTPGATSFLIMNRATGKCLTPDSSASGANLRVTPCDLTGATALQKWSFTNSPFTPFSTLRVKNASTGMCMTTVDAQTAVDTLVEMVTCDAGGNDSVQSWVVTR